MKWVIGPNPTKLIGHQQPTHNAYPDTYFNVPLTCEAFIFLVTCSCLAQGVLQCKRRPKNMVCHYISNAFFLSSPTVASLVVPFLLTVTFTLDNLITVDSATNHKASNYLHDQQCWRPITIFSTRRLKVAHFQLSRHILVISSLIVSVAMESFVCLS